MSSEDFLTDRWLKKLDKQGQDLVARIGVDRKTFGEVFDTATLLRLERLISNKVLSQVDFIISTGKEANIFRAVTPVNKFVALKIYRTSTLTFKHIQKYIEGDPRFRHVNKNRRDIIDEWARKEYKNLDRLYKAKILVPKPLKRFHNILIMEYLGINTKWTPLLKDVPLENPQKIFETLLQYIDKMYRVGIVHADFSAYNVLWFKQKPYIIDVGQAVVFEHPLAYEFLKRDIHNIVQFFQKYDIKANEETIYRDIVRKEAST